MKVARSSVIALLAATLLAGCASSGTSGSSTGRQMNLITRSEIVELGPASAHDVVQRLRPHMLQTRVGGELMTPQVFVDGIERGNVGVLVAIPSMNVESIRFVARDRQSTLAGAGNVPAIHITTVKP